MNERQTHLMIDLETAGSGPRAAILSIGAVVFDPRDPGWKDGARFEAFLSFKEAFRIGVADGDTFAWWLKQSQAAREALLAPVRESPRAALHALARFYRAAAAAQGGAHMPVWGNGATFDITILEAAFAACEMSAPWRYSAIRDCRTLKDAAGPVLTMAPRDDVPHSALDDAIYQAEWVARGFAAIRNALDAAAGHAQSTPQSPANV